MTRSMLVMSMAFFGGAFLASAQDLFLAAFPESRLITPPQGALLNSWANQTAGQEWTLCYTSFTMSKASPAEFHKGCDQYKPTVTVARNSGGRGICGKCPSDAPRGCRGSCSNSGADCWPISSPCGATNKGGFTFGGFADDTWSGGGGSGPFSGANKGTNATFLFGLGPGKPARYGPTSALCPTSPKMCSDKDPNAGCPNLGRLNCSCCLCSNVNDCERTIYMFAKPDLWPNWGYNGMGTADLDMGGLPSIRGPPGVDSTALGANAGCTVFFPFVKDLWAFNGPGSTYTGPTNHDGCANDPAGCLSLCGGSGNWGETELEVWRLASSRAVEV